MFGQSPNACSYIMKENGADCVVAQRGCCPSSLVEGTCRDNGDECPSTFDCTATSTTMSATCKVGETTTSTGAGDRSIVNYNEPRGVESSGSNMVMVSSVMGVAAGLVTVLLSL